MSNTIVSIVDYHISNLASFFSIKFHVISILTISCNSNCKVYFYNFLFDITLIINYKLSRHDEACIEGLLINMHTIVTVVAALAIGIRMPRFGTVYLLLLTFNR